MPNLGARKGPLRKIVATLYHSGNVYSRDKCLLECGHTAYTNGIYRARCRKCRELVKDK